LANKDAHIKLYKSSVNIRINYFSQRVWMDGTISRTVLCMRHLSIRSETVSTNK